jgi:3-phenylpropionate/cinnamic acid dioxygenase small subunit
MGAVDERRRRAMKLSRTEAEDFLYHEADLLDRREFDEWLTLFTEDGIYWLPMEETDDPLLQSSILYDDTKMREMRVHQIVRKAHYAQLPRSRTVHAVSNVRVLPTDLPDGMQVHCNVMVTELREGNYHQHGLGNHRIFAGHGEYCLRRDNDRLVIAMKKLILLNRDLPIENLSFIL